MYTKNRCAIAKISRQRGQGMVEFGVAASFFIVPLLIGIVWLARVESTQQHLHQAARYAAWERTVWHRSGNTYVTKTDTDVAREVTKRIYAPVRNSLDTNRDRQAVNMNQDQLDPFLYTQSGQGNASPMLRPNGAQRSRASATYQRQDESNAIASILNGVGRLLQLQSDGIATSVVSADLEVIPSIRNLGVLPATFTTQSKNALLGGAWNANGPQGEAKTVKRTVLTDYANDIPGFDLLKSLVGVLFPEFNNLDLGRVDTEKMACQRVSGMRRGNSNC
jgi:hypothetical protein